MTTELFDISEQPIQTDIPRIVNGYRTLFHYDRDVLFTGYNVYGMRILGSLSKSVRATRQLRYLHCVITERQYDEFINQRIGYSSILQKNKSVFIVDKTFDGDEVAIYYLNIGRVPVSYLPLHSFMRPLQYDEFSRIVTAKLQGGTANGHRVAADTLADIRGDLTELLQQPIQIASRKANRQRFSIFEHTNTPGSYAISFEIAQSSEPEHSLMIDAGNTLDQFIPAYLRYCFHDLLVESQIITEKDIQTSDSFATLIDFLRRMSNRSDESSEALRKRLLKSLLKAANSIADITSLIGPSFSNIVLLNGGPASTDVIGVVDDRLDAEIKSAVETIENKIMEVSEDARPTEYYISIHHLNTDTRQGNAVVRDKTAKISFRPKIHIGGHEDLVNTKYTQSLYQGIEVPVLGIARRVDGKIKKLEIEFEEDE